MVQVARGVEDLIGSSSEEDAKRRERRMSGPFPSMQERAAARGHAPSGTNFARLTVGLPQPPLCAQRPRPWPLAQRPRPDPAPR